MARVKVYALLALSLIAGLLVTQAIAQTPADPTEGKFILGFRMIDWKAKHIHDAKAAASYADTLRKLGCEVKTIDHDGHADVQCRTVYWKSLALDTPEQVSQWQTWLEQAGFDAIHGRPASSQTGKKADGTHLEVVKYRLVDWKSQHIHQPGDVGQTTTLFRSLGCQTETLDHSGHKDLRYRCPEWREIELPNHDAAHKWQEYLIKAGFETAHEH